MPNNPLSNLSYTNKDFNSIYVELLDLVKQLTYKWDPSMSNEADPGNILLKLDAIIGDKNNYNIDKNILENFPETLTQEISARSLYKQLAYTMPWYRAAVTDVSFKWIGTDNYELTEVSNNVIVPKFQLICDSDSQFIYTTLQDMVFNKGSKVNTVSAMEGIINTLNINGQEVVELSNLDYKNRIYFDENNIAENGIFIYNQGGSDSDYWKMVENLEIEPLGNKYFEFGVDSRKNLCYIEFPSDINHLIGSGLIIKYIVTNGSKGNIISRVLDRFYQDVAVEVNGESVVLTPEIIQISNVNSTNNGFDPEDTDLAYKHYRKTAGTFHTLVTLRDYINAIYNSGLVSNVKVCDRLKDVQSTYTIVTDETESSADVTQVANDEKYANVSYCKVGSGYIEKPVWIANKFFRYNSNNHTMMVATKAYFDTDENWKDCYYITNDHIKDLNAFDLRMYVLHNPGNISTFEDYVSTFDMEPSGGIVEQNILGYINSEKCVQHDFKEILPNKPCLFKNVFPLSIKIIPHYKLGVQQITELKININKALFKVLNSNALQFGVEADYDTIYDTIYSADERIKVLILDDFSYTTLATYWDGNQFKDIPISELNSSNIIIIDDINFGEFGTEDYNEKLISSIEDYKDKLNYYLYTHNYFITKSNNDVYKVINDEVVLYSEYINEFRLNILTKSILAGRTPLYKQDNLFDYTIYQNKLALTDTDKLGTHLRICPHGFKEGTTDPVIITKDNYKQYQNVEYKLKENENLRFLAPSFTTKTSYSNYVKFELILNEGHVEKKETTLRYNDYKSDMDKYEDIPITYYEDLSGTINPIKEIVIEYNDIYQEYKNNQNADILNTDASKYLNRLVTVRNSNYEIVYSGSTLSGYILSYPDFISKWKNNQYIVTSDLLISDLTDTYLALWETGVNTVTFISSVCSIPSNIDYQLKNGEYITFFYKTEDDIDAPYTYEKYEAGTIIKPSFSVKGTLQDDALINVNNLMSNGIIPYNDLPHSDYQKIYGMYNYNDLSGTKKIEIRGINEVEILTKQEEYYYFISNNTEEIDGINCYTLQPNEDGTYILNNEEYFIHLNSQKTTFEVMGAGTLLKFSRYSVDSKSYVPFTEKLNVKAIDYSEVVLKGISSFIDACKKMTFQLLIREQQIYNFSKGDVVSFSLDTATIIDFENNRLDRLEAPCFTTGENTSIERFTIGYTSGGSIQNLPKIDLYDDSSIWKATAVLNIYSNYDTPQKVDMNDKYSYKKITLKGIDYSPDESELYILSNIALDKVGGHNIDITYLDSYGKRNNTYIFIYNISSSYKEPLYYQNADRSISYNIYYVKDESDKKLKLTTYKSHSMILTIRNITDSVLFTIKKNGTYLKALNSDIQGSQGYGNGKYYFILDNNAEEISEDIIIECTSVKGIQETDKLIIYPLFKFTYNEYFEENYNITYEDIYNRIKYLDVDNIFNYTHNVTNDLLIKDPLKSKSFFEVSHIFNDYVLPMADLYMSDETQSNITLINNR